MTTNRPSRASCFPSHPGCRTARGQRAARCLWRTAALGGASLYLMACTALPAARMALPAGLDEATRAALTQVALALGLLFDPAVTPG